MPNVRTVVRMKPLSPGSNSNYIRTNNNGITVLPIQDVTHSSEQRYEVDSVLDKHTSGHESFVSSDGHRIINQVMSGINCSIFAYGSTGTGKTYSIEGSGTTTGVTQEFIREIMKTSLTPHPSNSRDKSSHHLAESIDIKISYIEIWNERVRDLLSTAQMNERLEPAPIEYQYNSISSKLNCSKPRVASEEGMLSLFNRGRQSRRILDTGDNDRSSRSHTIFTIYVQNKQASGKLTQGSLNIVDLAGDERLNDDREERVNLSLFYLQQVFECLSKHTEETNPELHGLYRNSALTSFLSESLNGTSEIVILACISPSDTQRHVTHSTLDWVCKTRKIRITPRAQMTKIEKRQQLEEGVAKLRKELEKVNKQATDEELNKTIENLRRENAELREKKSSLKTSSE